jgi:hypothetical protein
MMMLRHPSDPFQTDPVILESQDRAAKLTRTFCERGLDAFEFKNDDGRHYVVARGEDARRCFEFDRLVAFTSSRMVEALKTPWAEGGRA